MELALIRTLMQREFYEDNKGSRTPDKLFTAHARKIKQVVDHAMQEYDGDVNPSDIEALFFTRHSTLTTANKEQYKQLFKEIRESKPLGYEISQQVLSDLFKQHVGAELVAIGMEYVNNELTTLEPLHEILDKYSDDFIPRVKLDWVSTDIDSVIAAVNEQTKWKFNIPSLRNRVEGVSGGHLIIVGARPNTGKTSFHASVIGAPNGFADQGAKCVVLCNEEAVPRVIQRYISAATGMNVDEIVGNPALATAKFKRVRDNIKFMESMGKDLEWVEAVVKTEKPDIVVLDMGDKFAARTSDKSDVYLKEAAIYARNIAKKYECAVIWMSQLSADAQNRVYVDQSMLEGSKTGKAAEADLMVLISQNPVTDNTSDTVDKQRHLNIAKNKLKGGWHGVIHCELEGDIATYKA